ncbi:MAG: hypothetical protein ABI338_01215 [Gemmatimonadaceae bacterium]
MKRLALVAVALLAVAACSKKDEAATDTTMPAAAAPATATDTGMKMMDSSKMMADTAKKMIDSSKKLGDSAVKAMKKP